MSEALLASTHGVEAVRPGGPADLVALDVDPFQIRGEELGSIVSALTIAGGKVSHTSL
jgi:predicted amidohydrolase YtcJ